MHEFSRKADADFAKKDILGRAPVYEAIGPGEDVRTIRGRLFPFKLGGRGALALADAIRLSQAPQMVVRGDGTVLGWFIITSINEREENLAANGVGQLIGVDIEIKRADAPTAAYYFAALFSLLP